MRLKVIFGDPALLREAIDPEEFGKSIGMCMASMTKACIKKTPEENLAIANRHIDLLEKENQEERERIRNLEIENKELKKQIKSLETPKKRKRSG